MVAIGGGTSEFVIVKSEGRGYGSDFLYCVLTSFT